MFVCSYNNYDPLSQLEAEARAVVTDMLNDKELQVQVESSYSKIVPFVQSSRHVTYKSSLVSHLNRNPFLSKHRLTWVKNSIFFLIIMMNVLVLRNQLPLLGWKQIVGYILFKEGLQRILFNC